MSEKRLNDLKEELGVGRSTRKRACRSSEEDNVRTEADDMLVIKAEYDYDIAKIQLRPSSGIDKLVEEVSKRLDLEIGSFKLKYEDEECDEILLACDDDLQLCAKNFKTMGKSFLRLFVDLK